MKCRCEKCENCIIDTEEKKECYFNLSVKSSSCKFYLKGTPMTKLEYYYLRDSSVKYIEKRMDILNKN